MLNYHKHVVFSYRVLEVFSPEAAKSENKVEPAIFDTKISQYGVKMRPQLEQLQEGMQIG